MRGIIFISGSTPIIVAGVIVHFVALVGGCSPALSITLRGCDCSFSYITLPIPCGLAERTSLRPLHAEEVLRTYIV
jgi:hypothetical protein